MPLLKDPLEVIGLLRFYTLPPSGVFHEYICVNPKSANQLLRRKFSHAICDSGVHYFYENPTVKDYPNGYLEDYASKAKELSFIFGKRIWITIPDYPDDYYPGQFGDNVELTLSNIERFLEITGINWMPTIQSKFKNINSFENSCKKLLKLGDFERVAIGTVCKVRELDFIVRCCRIARRYFPNAWIHAFGPPLNCISDIKHYVNSFDSTAWTFPRSPHRPSCKTALERREYFSEFKNLLNDKLEFNNTSILDFV